MERGMPGELDPEAVTLRENGFLVFTVDWRLACAEDSQNYAPEVLSLCGWPWQKQAWETGEPHAAVQDVEDAVSWVKDHAASYWSGWNGKVAALGSSAGGTALLEAIAEMSTPEAPLVDVAATWSAKMEFAAFDTPPTGPDDPFQSKDTCDHSHAGSLDPMDRGRAAGCWFGVDRYLDSFYPNGKPHCGFDESGAIDRDTTDIDPANPEQSCEPDKAGDWVDASPQVSWGCLCAAAFGPVFFANGGGPDRNDVLQAETVPLEEALEFQGTLLGQDWLPADAVLCTVNTPLHSTNYRDLPCNDDTPSVFDRTIAFFNDHLTP